MRHISILEQFGMRDISVRRHFGPSDISVHWHFGTEMFWYRDVLVPRHFGTEMFYMKQVLHPCKKQLDWAPTETPAKIAGLGNSRNTSSKITWLGTSRNYSIWIILENSRPPACYFQGNSWKLGPSIFQVIGKEQASGLPFSGELLETGGVHNSS